MTAPHLRFGLSFTVCVVLAGSLVFAQGAQVQRVPPSGGPLTLGPLTVTVPGGWMAQTSTSPAQIFSPDSTPQQYMQVDFFPAEQTSQSVGDHHQLILSRLAAFISKNVPQQNGVLGHFIWTKFELQRPGGAPETMILYSTKAGAHYIGVSVDASNANLVSRNLPALEAMLRGATLSNASLPAGSSTPGSLTAGSAAPASGGGSYAGPQASSGGPGSLDDYVFATPPRWTAAKDATAIALVAPGAATGERCVLQLWPMRAGRHRCMS